MDAITDWLMKVYKGDLAGVQRALESDPSLASMPSGGEYFEAGVTALHLAALGGHEKLVQLLLDYGASPNVETRDGSPLMQAAYGAHVNTVRLLLAAGARADYRCRNGETALHFAAFRGQTDIARMLLERGASPSIATTEGMTDIYAIPMPVTGETPLHLAAANGHSALVRLLLDHGADRHAKDRVGLEPIHWAARHRRHDIIRMLSETPPDAAPQAEASPRPAAS